MLLRLDLPCDAEHIWQMEGSLLNHTEGKQATVVNNV